MMQAPRWNGSGTSDTLLSGYTVFPSILLAKVRNHKVTRAGGQTPGICGELSGGQDGITIDT